MENNENENELSEAAAALGRRGKGIPKTLTPEDRERRAELAKGLAARRKTVTVEGKATEPKKRRTVVVAGVPKQPMARITTIRS